MHLTRLAITNLRNIEKASFQLNPKVNLFVGENGSGKTSILESVYFLGHGRSFRSRLLSRVINYDQESLLVFGRLDSDISLGIEKTRSGDTRIKIDNEETTSVSELAKNIPLQLICPDSYRLLDAGPKFKRQFMDWGLFHVEHTFSNTWNRYRSALKQRNAALREGRSKELVQVWNHEITAAAAEIDRLRQLYIDELNAVFQELYQRLSNLDVKLDYRRGWTRGVELSDLLVSNYSKDLGLGYTFYGAHRADLKLLSNGRPVEDIFSRGQKKVLICALKLAQGILLKNLASKNCIYLLDDLAAELDAKHRELVFDMLKNLDAQIFLTSVDKQEFKDFVSGDEVAMFHVEHQLEQL